jgi:hypothetical protein
LPRDLYDVQGEVQLTDEPLRLDTLIIRLRKTAPPPPRRLGEIIRRLGPFTLMSFKGPTDELEADDALSLLAYACQFIRLRRIEHSSRSVVLMMVANTVTPRFLRQVEELAGSLTRTHPGLWEGHLAGMALCAWSTAERSQEPHEHLLGLFSRSFLQTPQMFRPVDEEEIEVWWWLYRNVQQFKMEPGVRMAKDMDKVEQGYQKTLAKIIEEGFRTLPSSELASFPRSTMARIVAEGLQTLPSSELASFPRSTMARIVAEGLQTLPSSELASFPRSTMARIVAEGLQTLPSSELASLIPKETLAKIVAEHLPELEPSVLPETTVEKVLADATAEQVAGLSPEAKARLLALLTSPPAPKKKRPASKKKEK